MSTSFPARLLLRRVVAVGVSFAILPLGTAAAPATAQSQPTGAVAYTAATPDGTGGHIADGLAAVALDGSNPRRLTSTVTAAPQWSPDGRWVASTEMQGETQRPVALRASDGAQTVLADEGLDPTWSADGTLLAWTATAPEPHLVVAQVQSTDPDLVLGSRASINLPYTASQPRISPDGTLVAFRMRRGDGSGADLWITDVNGSTLRQLSAGVDVSVARPDTHSWSPDGGRIVFLGADAASRGLPRAHIVDADGTGQRLLFGASPCEYQHGAAWAPHGEFLAVLQSCQTRGLFIVTPQGELLGRVGAGGHRFGGFEFSADGALLYAAITPRVEPGAPYAGQLRAFPVDGSAPWTLTDDPPAAPGPVDVVTTSQVEVRVVMPPRDSDAESPDARSDIAHACPSREVPYADFFDVSTTNAHRLAIDCMAWWGVVNGVEEYTYAPGARMTRAQMASLLVRMITKGGGVLPETPGDHFDDDSASVHQASINRLAEAGIVKGSGSRRYLPGAPVRRDHMASFIIAAYEFTSDVPLDEPTTDYFDDDNTNLHEESINRAAQAGFVAGLGDGRYGPAQLERRDQAASRAARVLDALVEQGSAQRPPNGLATVTRIVDGDTFLANVPGTGTVRVRLIGLQAPESGTCNAHAATLSLRELVLDKSVRLSSDDASSVGNEQRPLRFAEVFTDGGWLDVGGEQLRRGHALWLPKEREPRNNNRYQLLVREAMASHAYLWNPIFCGGGPNQAAQLRMWVESNPPGPDRANVNGEWVRIHNVGDTAVDLAGWQLRDSSLRRPLKFAEDSLVAPGETMRVHVGEGTDEPLVRYWGWARPLFADAKLVSGQWVGDGAYLQDPHGDIRAYFIYPCIGACTDPLLGAVEITEVHHDTSGDDGSWSRGEYITLTNTSASTVSLYGYQLRAAPHVHDFPSDSTLEPGQSLMVYVGHGEDTATDQYWGHDTEILDDTDGRVILRTYDRIRISCWAWGAELCD